ncbi:hypothetical protein M527_03045 [Sphingobium indicum IP26]|uniref:RCK N-terminal domain-containing protein n=1 Tax=Sphingobium indicum F2 TaxID=1450518 RepID=A0A8E0WVK6_9SPHN|nr:NAD-binding protein [Sphingobium indicum]EPR11063.1 hypothetical protein M527_03045 [Sphingobium indicum IP26]KER38201.1 hypothetical protein AL00_02410 [Sphingobium indicum F2]
MLEGPARDLILAGAIFSILLNPLLFSLARRAQHPQGEAVMADEAPAKRGIGAREAPAARMLAPTLNLLIGYGRVGSAIGQRLLEAGQPLLVIEDRQEGVEAARRDGIEVLQGNAAAPAVLRSARLDSAARVYVTVPDAFEAGQIVEQARHARADLQILARAHSEEAARHLQALGADMIVIGQQEIARRMPAEPVRPAIAAAPPRGADGGADA